MSDSVRPHRRQLTRLPHPWDSPGKNTGVSFHFLLQYMKVKSESEVSQSCLTLSNPMDCKPTRLLHPWDFPGKSIGVGCHCHLCSRSIGPLQCLVGVSCRILICCTCHFQSGSLFFVYFDFLCLQVTSVSNIHPYTKGLRWSLI